MESLCRNSVQRYIGLQHVTQDRNRKRLMQACVMVEEGCRSLRSREADGQVVERGVLECELRLLSGELGKRLSPEKVNDLALRSKAGQATPQQARDAGGRPGLLLPRECCQLPEDQAVGSRQTSRIQCCRHLVAEPFTAGSSWGRVSGRFVTVSAALRQGRC